jgi:type IV pilus assembly protein PilA
MIVVAIIGILAAVAIPKFAQMIERAKEGATKSNLGAIRSAVSIYYGKNEGVYPTDIGASTAFVGTADSNYMQELPKATATPLGNTNAVTAVSAVPTGAGSGWAFNSVSGEVWCNSTASDSKAAPFTSY